MSHIDLDFYEMTVDSDFALVNYHLIIQIATYTDSHVNVRN